MSKAGVLVAVVLFNVAVVGTDVTAQTRPATAPATTQVDAAEPSTPKGSLKALAQALDAGDRAKVLELLAADTEAERNWARATAELAEATAALRRSASDAFGVEASRPLGVDRAATGDALARIDAATVTLTGDRANVRAASEEGPPLVLIRRDRTWLVPVSEFSKDVETADLDRASRALADETRLLRELAVEVSTGKYKTATDARQALDRRIMQSAMPQLEPAAPATGATK